MTILQLLIQEPLKHDFPLKVILVADGPEHFLLNFLDLGVKLFVHLPGLIAVLLKLLLVDL